MSVYRQVHTMDKDAAYSLDRRLGSGKKQLQGGFLQYLPLISLATKALGLGKSAGRRKRGGAMADMEGAGFLSGLLSLPASLAQGIGLGKPKRGRKRGGIVDNDFIHPFGSRQMRATPIYAMGKSAGVKKYRKRRGQSSMTDMEGAGFFDFLGDVGKTVGNVVKKGIEIAPDVISTAKTGLDLYKTVRGGKKRVKKASSATDGRKSRALLVKQVMKEQGLSLPAASKYVKDHQMY